MYQTRSMQENWGLEKPPFPSGLDTRLFYEGASQRESLARLRFLLAHRRRLGLVLGETGLGKSLLLAVFAEQCRQSGQAAAEIDLLGLSSREFYWQLGSQLQAPIRLEDDMLRMHRQIADRLHENSLQGKQTVVVLDDLDQVGPDLLNQVQRLLRTTAAHRGWLTIIGSTNTSRLDRLGKGLLELADLRIDLGPWDELDTIGYLQLALFEAGAERPLFDDQAMTQLHSASGGVPRMLNRLAEFTLLAGAEHGREIVDGPAIQAACEALNLPISG